MAKNSNLHAAKTAKNDEFYTQLSDIEKELKHYKDFFKDKTVFCNCGDAIHHNFGKYFSLNFEHLGLKKLICTSFNMDGSPANVAFYYGDKNGNRVPDPDEWEIRQLKGNGDFRSEECVELLKEADVVVSNPPFSLFNEYVAQLMEYNKKFLIIGNQNAVTFKEIFPLIKENKLWWGTDCIRWFIMPKDTDKVTKTSYNGENIAEGARSRWFTNIELNKRHQPLDLYKKYSALEYPKYDNYDAIECGKVAEIPMDYDGVIGVPITFLDKYCPEQFEIIDINPHFFSIVEKGLPKPKQLTLHNVGKKDPYARILIRRIG